jgi:predicted nucleic acid-binding protein
MGDLCRRVRNFINVIETFDTNILIYAADHRDPEKQSAAIGLLRVSLDAVLLWQVACEFISASRKLQAHGFTLARAWRQLEHYLRVYPLELPEPAVLDNAKALHINHGWSFWDAMIVAACNQAGVARLYSEDLPGGPAPGRLEIVNPFAH